MDISLIHRVACAAFGGLGLGLVLGLTPLHARAQTQVVFLDFDSETEAGEFAYSAAQRNFIEQRVADDYALFDFAFTQVQPAVGDYSTIYFNAGPEYGLADDIDFRNLNRNDSASVFIDLNNGFTTAQFINLSASTAAHELGHLQGLRHGDSFGPIGAGIDLETVYRDEYFPELPAGIPSFADQTRFHLMESDYLDNELDDNQYFGQRSAIKLSFNERGTVTPEQSTAHGSFATAQHLNLPTISVPNTLVGVSEFAGMDFFADIEVVTAAIANNETDLYRFDAQVGDLFNIEVISESVNRYYDDFFDSTLTVYDPNGNILDYYGEDAYNDDEFETFESILIDLPIPADGTYFIEVEGYGPGAYELLAYRFHTELAGLLGDYNASGQVEQGDLDLVLQNWGLDTDTAGVPSGWVNDLPGGQIEQTELDGVLSNWGSTSAPDFALNPHVVPEPAAVGVWLLGVAGLGRRAR